MPIKKLAANRNCKFRSPDASWHADYRDTAYIYIGGLPFELSEGDIITIFSQFGEPTYVNLVRDKETGKSRGFAFLKYEDQRSTDLAVDNLGGTTVMGRTLRVDHTRYKKKDDDTEEGSELKDPNLIEDTIRKSRPLDDNDSEGEERRPMLKEERELEALLEEHDDDPMKDFLIQEKRDEVTKALARLKGGKSTDKDKKSRHRHHHSHRSSDKSGRGERESHSRRHREERRKASSRDRSNDRGSDDDGRRRSHRASHRD